MTKQIYSMTGFSTERIQFEESELTCEIRSLNSRYLEINAKLPYGMKALEDNVKSWIRSRLDRGKINCVISFETTEQLLQSLKLNKGALSMYTKLLEEIRSQTGINTPLQLSDLLFFKDIFTPDDSGMVNDAFEAALEQLVNNALDRLNKTRSQEGGNLRRDLEERLKTIEKLNEEIKEMSKDNARIEFDKLHQRLISLIGEQKIDANRLEQELAIISDRVDINEETVRMDSHIGLFRKNLQQGSPIGKKLNFMLQEMHREANTISTKNTMIGISHRIVQVKEEIERMREQVQNIE